MRIPSLILAIVLAFSVIPVTVALAATLHVQSAKLTVFKNTLQSPTIAVELSATSTATGQPVHASASLADATSNAGGSVRYTVYADSGCTAVYASGTKAVAGGIVPESDGVTFTSAGTYYWGATYSGDGNNQPTASGCASHPLTVSGAGEVQHTVAASDGTEVTASLSPSPTPGHLLVAIVSTSKGNATITLSTPGWSTAIISSGNPAQAIYYKIADPDELATVAARTDGNGIAMALFEYSGIDSAAPFGRAVAGTAASDVARDGGPFTCGNVTVLANERLLVTGLAMEANGSVNVLNPWQSSFVERADQLSGNLLLASAQRIVPGAGTFSTGSSIQGGTGSGSLTCHTATFNVVP